MVTIQEFNRIQLGELTGYTLASTISFLILHSSLSSNSYKSLEILNLISVFSKKEAINHIKPRLKAHFLLTKHKT